jgi:hypothetical protein
LFNKTTLQETPLEEEDHLKEEDLLAELNKKGGLLGFATFIIFFICIWAFWMGSFLQEWGLKNIADNGLTGIEAMFWANLNLWIFLGLIATIYIGIKFGGGQQ